MLNAPFPGLRYTRAWYTTWNIYTVYNNNILAPKSLVCSVRDASYVPIYYCYYLYGGAAHDSVSAVSPDRTGLVVRTMIEEGGVLVLGCFCLTAPRDTI